MAVGRTSEPRTVTITTVAPRAVTVGTTAASTAITGAAGTFLASDVGQAITGAGIPAGATVAARTSDIAATLSVAATATAAAAAATITQRAVSGPAGAFNEEDAGRAITAVGVPAGSTLSAVTSETAAVLSAAATAGGTVPATLSGTAAQAYGFLGWSPETDAESETYTVAAANAGALTPDRMTDVVTSAASRQRGRG